MSARTWEPFGIPADEYDEQPQRNGVRVLNLALRDKTATKDRAASWLRNAMIALTLLAATAAAVSYEAQYVLVRAVKHAPVIAGLQAGIPDVGAAVFACLGIALALQGKRAVRARALNVVCVGISVTMNALASHGGWRPLAVWVMAPVLYALASDTLIGVIRAWSIARQRGQADALADDEATPLAVLGGVLLWLLRLSLAPVSTLGGFRRWVVEEAPVAPGRRGDLAGAANAAPALCGSTSTRARSSRSAANAAARPDTKTARFLALVAERHGPLEAVPLADVSRISTELAPEVQLHTGTARSALRACVLQARGGASA